MAAGALSFFTSRMFLGGADHLRDKRSLSPISVSVRPGFFNGSWRNDSETHDDSSVDCGPRVRPGL